MDLAVAQVRQISFGKNHQDDNSHDGAKVAAEVGAVGVTAHVGAGKGSMLQQMYQNVIKTRNQAARSEKVATGIWARLSKDTKRFSEFAMKKLKAFENTKIIGPIIKSPITKKVTGVFGGITAVFVLISGLSEAAQDGKFAIGELANKFDTAA